MCVFIQYVPLRSIMAQQIYKYISYKYRLKCLKIELLKNC